MVNILFFVVCFATNVFIDKVIKKRETIMWEENFIIALLVTLIYAIL